MPIKPRPRPFPLRSSSFGGQASFVPSPFALRASGDKRPSSPKKKVIFLVGPTGVGKTDISIKLAKKIDGEIICCDSMQIYKGMDILTAKPTEIQLSRVPHHLFSIKYPTGNFSVAAYRKLALRKIEEIHSRKKIPIFVGGTGLYVKALLDGLFSSPGKDTALREKLKKQTEKYGSQKLYNKLKEIDPVSAAKIHPNDSRRIIRAIEVYQTTGKTISQLKNNMTKGGIFSIYPTQILCFYYEDRKLLYCKITDRVEEMFKKGLVDEVKKLLKNKLSLTARQALGIKEIEGFICGRYTQEQAKELLKRNTRRYAKRQLSWFRQDERIRWIALNDKKLLTYSSGGI